MQGSDKTEIRTPYLLQHAYCVMIANPALGNMWVLPGVLENLLAKKHFKIGVDFG